MEKFGLIFVYSFNGDTITYKMLRDFDDIEEAKTYAKIWVKYDGKRFGKCLFVDIIYNTVPICTIYFNKRNNPDITINRSEF